MNLYFIYLGKKQNSRDSIQYFRNNSVVDPKSLDRVSEISRLFVEADSYPKLNSLIEEHENILSGILKLPTIKESRFSDLDGQIKSLGGWGGDFAMISTSMPEESLKQYLSARNITTIYKYQDLVLE